MTKKAVVLILMSLALVTLACGVGSLTLSRVKTGPTITEEIGIDPPSDGTTELTVSMGAGELFLDTGPTDRLVEGTIRYNVADLEPTVLAQGSRLTIEQGDLEGKRIPIGDWDDVENRWDLTLGTAPLDLSVNAGAAKAELSGLADLNAAQMAFNGGAGDFTLDFAGTLQRDMRITINAGASQLTIVVPEGTAATLAFEGALTDIDTLGGWQRSGNTFSLPGSGPALEFEIRMGVGKLVLRN